MIRTGWLIVVAGVACVAGVPGAADAHRPSDYGEAWSERWVYWVGVRYFDGFGGRLGPRGLVQGTLGLSRKATGLGLGDTSGSLDVSGGLRGMHGKLVAGARYGEPDGPIVTTDATIVSAWLGGTFQMQLLPFLTGGLTFEWDLLGWSHFTSRDIEQRDRFWGNLGLGPAFDVLVGEHHGCRALVVFSIGGAVPADHVNDTDTKGEPANGFAVGLTYEYSPAPRPRGRSLWGTSRP